MMRLVVPLFLLCAGILALGALDPRAAPPPAATYSRRYWDVPVESLARGRTSHTHAKTRGVVVLERTEDDSDTHNRIRSLVDTSWIIAECIPLIPCRRFRVGDTVEVWGITRRDPEHKWWEIHPMEGPRP